MPRSPSERPTTIELECGQTYGWKNVVKSSGWVAVAATTVVSPSYSLKPRTYGQTWLGLGFGFGFGLGLTLTLTLTYGQTSSFGPRAGGASASRNVCRNHLGLTRMGRLSCLSIRSISVRWHRSQSFCRLGAITALSRRAMGCTWSRLGLGSGSEFG